MVDKIHYRWDFIGLSTDSKPTPAESPKVVDGSTYYESDTSKLYVFYKDTWYEKTATGGGASYTAGEGIDITDNEISVDTETIQPKLTAGTNITIDEDNVISAEAGGPTVVQTVGSSTTDVMSQNATTNMVFGDNSAMTKIKIGNRTYTNGDKTIAIGNFASAVGKNSLAIGAGTGIGQNTDSPSDGGIAIGYRAKQSGGSGGLVGKYGIAIGYLANTASAQECAVSLGAYSHATEQGQMDISTLATTNTYGYNNSQYRLLTGLYDGQSAHDAVTVEQVNSVIDAINAALSTSIPHIGA